MHFDSIGLTTLGSQLNVSSSLEGVAGSLTEATLRNEDNASLLASADFSALGSNSSRVELFAEGVFVGEFAVENGQSFALSDIGIGLPELSSLKRFSIGGDDGFALQFDRIFALSIGSGDEIRNSSRRSRFFRELFFAFHFGI